MNQINETEERLHRRLVAGASEAGLLDLSYRTVDSPVGDLLLVRSDAGLIRIAFASEGSEGVLESLAEEVSPRILKNPESLDRAALQLDEYFEGTRREFSLALDLRLVAGFQRTVVEQLGKIPWGRTESYSQIAREVGSPRAARAVGTACAINPLPLIVPCHRVVKADGSIGNYGGGAAAKRLLLDLEGHV